MKSVLIIDDEISILTALELGLEDKFKIYTAETAAIGMEILQNNDISVVLLDQRIGSVKGIDVLQKIKCLYPHVIVIIITAYASIEDTVEVIQRGAYYYISKPLNIQSLIILIDKALEYQMLTNEVRRLSSYLDIKTDSTNIVTNSKSMNNVLKKIQSVKDLDVTVLITGESGTGKELVAKSLHYKSKRADKNFEVINCAAIPYNLMESELFGYEKGAFTGANTRYKGKFELADKGTIFLDEIGEMDINMQAKLLRAIQEKKITPIGSTKSIDVDIRIIAATNRDLQEEVKVGRFREDLYFRLNVVNILVPPLRKRREDISMLSRYFMEKYATKFSKKVDGISKSAISLLEAYDYSGNVRELENIIERAVALSEGNRIEAYDLPESFGEIKNLGEDNNYIFFKIGETLSYIEDKYIKATLEYNNGNKKRTASMLGISERGLHNKV